MVTKAKWVEVMRAAGFSDDDMRRWHEQFEKSAPQEHQEFLEFLHIPADEIQSIRNWSRWRRFVSAGGSTYARHVLGVPVRDLTGGFKCFRREVLETLDLDAISSRGYAFQIETTYRALRAGFRVVEVPIAFVDRERGGSKMNRGIVLEAIWKVPLLRLQALRRRL